MGSLRRKTSTKPLPEVCELFNRKGETFVRWQDGNGKTRTAKTTTGRDGSTRIVVESGKWLAKYRDGSGFVHEVSTGCKDKSAAQAMLSELERRSELVRSGVMKADEEAVAVCQSTPLDEHLEAYLRSLRAAGRSDRHMSDTSRLAKQISADCGFRTLRDIVPDRVEAWLADRLDADMAARTRNSYLQSLKGFCQWCVRNRRLTTNPLRNVSKADEKTDRRLMRRALLETELQKLLYVARLRPLAELGRETIRKPADEVTGKRDTWKPAPLTLETIDAAVERARERLKDSPERIDDLVEKGRERALVLKTLLLTGLRKGELQSITVGQVHLDGISPYIELEAADEKNRGGSSIPLRSDLAEDIREWVNRMRGSSTLRIDGGDALPSDAPLFYVPSGLRLILDRDLKAAGIPKRDDRGRTIDVHALRHTFGTMLSQNGVAPRTAQAAMRHSKIDLTMNVYTDPRLLDVSGAMESLPSMPLDGQPRKPSETAKATGTDAGTAQEFPPMFPPGTAQSGISGSKPVILGKMTETSVGQRAKPETGEKPTKKAS
ncbi:MAG: site-specific integrase, partial [Rhodopirellula sp.]|nr:site-specific integrase [Rhodopirellula sp.]